MRSPSAILRGFVVGLALLPPATAARAGAPGDARDAIDALNAIRARPCSEGPARSPLVRVSKLESAAQRVAGGQTLREAVQAAGYRASNAALLQLEGVRSGADLRRALAQSCSQIAQPGLSDAGAFTLGRGVWIVLAQPFSVPELDKASVDRRLLELVNAARAQARRCGTRELAAARPVRWSASLERAAAAHARDMAAHATMSHAGSDGSTPAQRVARAGYAWSAVAENVAAGQRDAAGVVRSWLESPGHCTNLMGAQYTEMAAAFATNPDSDAGIYWAQVFAAPSTSRLRSSTYGAR